MRISLIAMLLILSFSSCGIKNGYHRTHYPNALKQGKLKKVENNVDYNDVCADHLEMNSSKNHSVFSQLNTDSTQTTIEWTEAQDTTLRDFILACDEDFHRVEIKNKEFIEYEVNQQTENTKSEILLVDEPEIERTNKKRLNRNIILAILMIPVLFLLGVLALFLLLENALILSLILVIVIFIACIVVIQKSIKGIVEVKNNKDEQHGTPTAVLAIFSAVIGMILSVLMVILLEGAGL